MLHKNDNYIERLENNALLILIFTCFVIFTFTGIGIPLLIALTGILLTRDFSKQYEVEFEVDKTLVEDSGVGIGDSDYTTNRYDYKIKVIINDKVKPITGELKWNHVPEASRPEKVVVKVVSGEEEIASQEVNKEGDWKYNIQVPVGLERYQIVVEIPGYIAIQEDNNFIVSNPETNPEETPEVNPETNPEETPEVNPETNPEETPEVKPEINPENKPEVKPSEVPQSPKTGDKTNVVMWLVIAGMTVAVSGVVVKKRITNI